MFFFFIFFKITNKAPIRQILHKVSLSCVAFKENSSYAVTQLGVYDKTDDGVFIHINSLTPSELQSLY